MHRAFWLSVALSAFPAYAAERRIELEVSRMTCASCPITVRIALRKVPGVIDAKVTLDPPLAEVIYDDTRTSPERLMRATADAGFPSSAKKQP